MSILPPPDCSCPCHTIPGISHVAACCVPGSTSLSPAFGVVSHADLTGTAQGDEGRSARAAAPTNGGVVHLYTSISRSGQWVLATTGCGLDKKVKQPNGPLVSIGLSAWSSDITCSDCRIRLGLETTTGVAA